MLKTPKAPKLTAKEPPRSLVDSMPPLSLGPSAVSVSVATNRSAHFGDASAGRTVRQLTQEPAAAPTKGLHR